MSFRCNLFHGICKPCLTRQDFVQERIHKVTMFVITFDLYWPLFSFPKDNNTILFSVSNLRHFFLVFLNKFTKKYQIKFFRTRCHVRSNNQYLYGIRLHYVWPCRKLKNLWPLLFSYMLFIYLFRTLKWLIVYLLQEIFLQAFKVLILGIKKGID